MVERIEDPQTAKYAKELFFCNEKGDDLFDDVEIRYKEDSLRLYQ